jgi:hypothetical protein
MSPEEFEQLLPLATAWVQEQEAMSAVLPAVKIHFP